MPYLKHETTGEIYPYTEALALRGDMQEVDSLVQEVAPVQADAKQPEPSGSLTQEQLDDIGDLVSGLT